MVPATPSTSSREAVRREIRPSFVPVTGSRFVPPNVPPVLGTTLANHLTSMERDGSTPIGMRRDRSDLPDDAGVSPVPNFLLRTLPTRMSASAMQHCATTGSGTISCSKLREAVTENTSGKLISSPTSYFVNFGSSENHSGRAVPCWDRGVRFSPASSFPSPRSTARSQAAGGEPWAQVAPCPPVDFPSRDQLSHSEWTMRPWRVRSTSNYGTRGTPKRRLRVL